MAYDFDKPWNPVWNAKWEDVERWYPGAKEAWPADCNWPYVIYADLFQLIIEDKRCWHDFHKTACECRIWTGYLKEKPITGYWKTWIKR